MTKIMLLLMITVFRMTSVWSFPHIYNTGRSSETDLEYDCVDYDTAEKFSLYKVESIGVSQIIRYCIRPSYTLDDQQSTVVVNKILTRSTDPFTFEQLHLEYDMTAEQLLSTRGYTSIDDIERYKIYLETLDESLSQEPIDRCYSGWFGPECQYIFKRNKPIKMSKYMLGNIPVDELNEIRPPMESALHMTCYTHLICNRGPPPACLDWREICDGKIDCANDDGIDERFCEQLEILECAQNEYRCKNGRQCIPKEFYRDDPLNPDCQDGSDEILSNSDMSNNYTNECDRDPTFRCEERTCAPNELACGDGQCVEYFHQCHNHRGRLLMMEFEIYSNQHLLSSCRSLPTRCDTHIEDMEDKGICKESCWSSQILLCAPKLGQLCASTVFKESPSIFRPNHDIYIFYNYNEVPSKQSWVVVPHDNCFTDTDCNNTEVYTDNPYDSWCSYHQNRMHLSYAGSYSRNDFTATIQRLTRWCSKKLIDSDISQESSNQYEKTGKSIFQEHPINEIRDPNMNGTNLYDDSSSLNDQRRIRSTYDDKSMKIMAALNDGGKIVQQINWIENFPFSKYCDGIQHVKSVIHDGMNLTDETECDYWPCNNVYTRCNGDINCPDETDELNCSRILCLNDEYPCVSVNNTKIECLPQSKVGDSVVDCIGGTDENPNSKCDLSSTSATRPFLCLMDSICIKQNEVCNGVPDCPEIEDENVCESFSLNLIMSMLNCYYISSSMYLYSEYSFCFEKYISPITFFSLMNVVPYPLTESTRPFKNHHLKQTDQTPFQSSQNVSPRNIVTMSEENTRFHCHRGFVAYVATSIDENSFELKCFCPPSYYGNQCQYQTDRVSLTLRFRFSINQRSAFIFLITLRDENHHINSFVIYKYQPSVDCDTKFSSYLLYSAPMKDKKKYYFIHIDLFKQEDLSYYASWHLPIHHSVLPVSRMAAVLRAPAERTLPMRKSDCSFRCQHGQCMKYINMEKYFCQCEPNWYGLLCDTNEHCDCSPDSRCMGSANSRPICICPPYKVGPRCLINSLCYAGTCLNGGTCLQLSNQDNNLQLEDYRCICTDEFEGDRCEQRKTTVSLQFVGIQTYSFIIIHILSTFTIDSRKQSIAFQKLRINSNTADIFISSEIDINLIFVQFDKTYYLAVVQESNTNSSTISSIVSPERQCYDVRDLLDPIIVQSHALRSLKHYPRLCRERTDLVCFHDERLMCLCTIDHFSNCFEFNFTNNVTCHYENPCEKEGRCLEDRPKCPSIVQCICSECYYGTRCQFSTVGLGVSLDAMLGYQIQPMKPLSEQQMSVKVSAILTIVMVVVGLIGSIMSLLTFQQHETREVGCGIYLLTLSVTSLLTMIMFTLKFWFLFFIQTAIITHPKFLHINCLLMDVSTQVSLSTSNWLGACVAVERTVSVIWQIRFNKKRSKQMSIWVVPILIIFVTLTHLPDPLHRVLIDDQSEDRKWCIVRYPSSLERFNSINIFIHFVVPFAINAISALIIIIVKARTRFIIKQQESYLQHLYEQFHDFRHLLISPSVLVLLTVPRLMLAFLPGCMKTIEDLWIYLAGYFVSFVPPLLTFPIFVLPSRLYREQFSNQIKRLFKAIGRLCRLS